MATSQDRGEDPVHHVFLAHDPLGHLALEAGDRADQPLQLLDVVVSGGLGDGHDN